MKKLFIRYDLCEDAVRKLRRELLRKNHIVPIDTTFWDDEYPAVRLEIAKRVLSRRAREAANNRQMCQAVLDKIDELFLAKG